MKNDTPPYKLFFKFLRYIVPYRSKQAVILIFAVLGMLLGLVNPYLSKLVVDKAIANRDIKLFIILAVAGTAIFIANGLLSALASILKRGVRLRVNFDINKSVFGRLQRLPLGFFHDKSTGEHIYKVNRDIERAVDLIASVPEESIGIFPTILLTLIIIFRLNWQLALFSCALAPLLYVPAYYFTRRMHPIWKAQFKNEQRIFARLGEVFSHLYFIKAAGKEKKEIRGYLKALIENFRLELKNVRLEVANNFMQGGLSRLLVGVLALFGGLQIIRGRISMGTLAAIMLYVGQLNNLQGRLVYFFQRVAYGLISCRRLDEILREKPTREIASSLQKSITLDCPNITFQRVGFGYRPAETILHSIDFTIEKGFAALVGPSGCGKTTIINLILGLYEPREGEILIAGHAPAHIAPASLRAQISVALQEPFLWNDTIANNIRYLKEGASDAEIAAVAAIAGVDEFVRTLPQRYDSLVGEAACTLSEGQKQKIAIARALLIKPKILILDEAMSSMDSYSEEKMMKEIRRLAIPLVIVISHRLSTVMACDRAYFLKSNTTMIADKPPVLLAADESFRKIFASQAADSLVS